MQENLDNAVMLPAESMVDTLGAKARQAHPHRPTARNIEI